MKYLGVIIDPKDLVTKEYVDNAVLGGTSTFYRKYENTYITSNVPISTIPIGMNIVTSADMIFVDINGLDLIQDVDYTISGTNIILTTPISVAGQNVHIILLRMVNITASDYNALKGDPGDVSDVQVNNNSVVSNGIANILPSALMNIFYPVGSYYETSDTTFDPNTTWGGTWVLETAGQVHVSAGTGYTIAGALSNTTDGGSPYVQAHTHAVATQPKIPAHAHNLGTGRQFVTRSDHSDGVGERGAANGTAFYAPSINKSDNWYGAATTASSGGGGSCTGTVIGAVSGATTGNSGNMPPYIVVNRWHRTA